MLWPDTVLSSSSGACRHRILRRRAMGLSAIFAATMWVSAYGAGSLPAAAPRYQLRILGTAQDGGVPQADCDRKCCRAVRSGILPERSVSCVAVSDPDSGISWMFDCTPDYPRQLQQLKKHQSEAAASASVKLGGIFLTHAHIGHYTGLIHLGREVQGTRQVPVWALPRMQMFLQNNGPWDQLIRLQNITIKPLAPDTRHSVAPGLSVRPLLVPHRDEYSETAAFLISGPRRTALYLPDIDKWERWDTPVEDLVRDVDIALLDGTFYSADELPGRDLSQIPHPTISESLDRFGKLPPDMRRRIRFIHLNHSNPALQPDSPEARQIRALGMEVAADGMTFDL